MREGIGRGVAGLPVAGRMPVAMAGHFWWGARRVARLVEVGPMLHHYESDATSRKVKHRAQMDDGVGRVERAGRELFEYLTQRHFFTCFDPDGKKHATVVPCEPRAMTPGKSAWHCMGPTMESHF